MSTNYNFTQDKSSSCPLLKSNYYIQHNTCITVVSTVYRHLFVFYTHFRTDYRYSTFCFPSFFEVSFGSRVRPPVTRARLCDASSHWLRGVCVAACSSAHSDRNTSRGRGSGGREQRELYSQIRAFYNTLAEEFAGRQRTLHIYICFTDAVSPKPASSRCYPARLPTGRCARCSQEIICARWMATCSRRCSATRLAAAGTSTSRGVVLRLKTKHAFEKRRRYTRARERIRFISRREKKKAAVQLNRVHAT